MQSMQPESHVPPLHSKQISSYMFYHDPQDSNNSLTVSWIRKLGKAYSNRNKLGRKIHQHDFCVQYMNSCEVWTLFIVQAPGVGDL